MCNKQDKKTIAVFVCLTSYHVYVSYAYAKYVYNNYGIRSRFLMYGVPNIEKVSIDYIETVYLERNESRICELIKKRVIYAGYFFKLSKIRGVVNRHEKVLLFVYNDLNPVSYKIIRLAKKYNSSNKIVIVDEGLAIYTDTKEKLRLTAGFYVREFILRYLFGSPSHYKAIGDDKRVDYVIVGETELYKTLRKAEGKIVLKQTKRPLFSYNYILDYVKTFFRVALEKIECTTVFIGQNYSGKGVMTEQEQILLDEVGEILNPLGKIIIKPHPTDNPDKYDVTLRRYNNFTVLDPKMSRIPMECLLGFLNSKYIVTFNSSAALNIASCFPEIEVIFLVDYKLMNSGRIPIRERLAGSNPLHALQFYSALERIKNVSIPKNADELKTIIKKNCKDTRSAIVEGNLQIYPEIDVLMLGFKMSKRKLYEQ